MKKIILLIALISVFLLLSGCYAKQYKDAKDAEKEAGKYLEQAQEHVQQLEQTEGMKKATEYVAVHEESDDEPQDVRVVGTTDGGTIGFGSKGDYRDEKGTQMCDFDYPFACSEYYASNDMLYLTLKYNGYPSKIDKVELSLAGELCDPVGNYMEPGTIKEFTCYLPRGVTRYSGDFEIKYFHNLDRIDMFKTGSIVVDNV